jgi:predicted MPP superfamily phosphohydrolase
MSRLIIVLIILFLLDLYAYKGLISLTVNLSTQSSKVIKIFYWIVSLVIILQLLNIFSRFREYTSENPEGFRFWAGIFFVLLFTKLAFVSFHFVDDVVWLFRRIISFFTTNDKTFGGKSVSRGTFITQIGLGASALIFGAYSYGVLKGRYAYKIFKEKISFSNLPTAFDGLRIVQISDLHLGSFLKDFDEVGKAIPLINNLNPDIILFTGDMVNVHSDEAESWITVFSKLKAKYGKYSVFGNHDYCDYGNHPPDERVKSINRLKEIHHEMGFQLLEDEHTFLEIDNQKIAIVGMHNWGKGFHEIGSLGNALKGLDDNYFKILLSHDPTLWEEKVKGQTNIDITFSGHTHGMQMGVEIPWLKIKWSPIKLRYKRWAGLYKFAQNYIYINRGFGFLGFPGRVGISPEITLIELKSENT